MTPGHAPRGKATRRCAVLLLMLGVARAAAAPKLQAIGEASVGYTDNFRNTPESPLVMGAARSVGAFTTLSPSVVLAIEAPRSLQRMSYRYEYDLFLAQASASGSSNQLDYRGFFELSPRMTLLLGSSASETNRYAAVAFSAPAVSTVAGLPAGGGAFAQATADATLDFDLAPSWRIWQASNVLFETPIFGTHAPQTDEWGLRSGIERTFSVDAAGFEARSDYTVVRDTVLNDGTPAGVQEQWVTNGVALWRHDWGRNFTSRTEAGVARVQRFNTGRGFWAPTGAAVLAFANQLGDAQLSYSHGISTNALLGQSLLADEFRLRGALPLTEDNRLLLALTAGYQRGHLIDDEANLAAHIAIANADVMLGWQATKALLLTLRYQHIQQVSDAAAPPLPLSFVQNNVLLGAVLKLPPDRNMPRPYRAAFRVDRTDEIREGTVSAGELQHGTEVPSH